MSVLDAVKDIKREVASITATIRAEISALDFSTDSALAIRDKYNAISLDVLGINYEKTVENRSLPPVNPSLLFDQQRVGLVDITTVGDVFLPSILASANLVSLQELYLSVGEDLNRVNIELDNHPPREPEDDRFTITLNQFAVRAIDSLNSDGLPKTSEEIATEIERNSFELFVFPELPSVTFLVVPEFISLNASIADTSRRLGIRNDQITIRVIWYGTINANTSNFSKMRTSFNLSSSQIRVAAFGDDLAISSSDLFFSLIENMKAQLVLVPNQARTSKVVDILDAVQEDARTFLAQIVFDTTTILSTDILSNLREAGIEDFDLETSLQNRTDDAFQGVNDTANALRTLAFPAQNNRDERIALGNAFNQSADTPGFTNSSLNVPDDLRGDVVTDAKRLVASIDARKIVVQKPTSSTALILQAIVGVAQDIASLQSSYETFLQSPVDTSRSTGTRTTESTNNMLTRAVDLVKSLRIKDQISNFPTDIEGNLEENLAAVLGALDGIADSLKTYFDIYRNGEVRDFLAAVVSVSSMTNLLLADGDPSASLIVKEVPARIEELRASVQSNILDDPESEELYSSVSLQVGAFASVLRGNERDDPVGRLFDLPVSIIDSVLPSEEAPDAFNLEMLPTQEAAMQQLHDSFALLKISKFSTNRDLSIYAPNFGCAITDAKFLLARLAGDSVNNLVAELRKTI